LFVANTNFDEEIKVSNSNFEYLATRRQHVMWEVVNVWFIALAIALFNTNQLEHEEGMLLVKDLASACPNTNPLGCHILEVSVMWPCPVINTDFCTCTLDTLTCSAWNQWFGWRMSRQSC
jgi:hypothetical protein